MNRLFTVNFLSLSLASAAEFLPFDMSRVHQEIKAIKTGECFKRPLCV